MDCRTENEVLESPYFKKNELFFSKSIELLSRSHDPNMTKNEHVYGIRCRPELDCGLMSNQNVNTIEGYVTLKLLALVVSEIFQENRIVVGRRRR